MTSIQFLAEWALRSSILILCGALLLWALRVKDSSVRLAAWTAMLCGSLAMPVFTAAFPKVPVAVMRPAPTPFAAPMVVYDAPVAPMPVVARSHSPAFPKRFDWAGAGFALYGAVALALLLRLCVGLAMSLRLLRNSRATDRETEGIEIRESDCVAAPVTLGIVRPAIVLPVDWLQWDGKKLDAVLAHERSHIRRCDPAVQLLSAIHRALLWHSPLSWFLHRRIVRIAEEASDDAALLVAGDRARYAEALLDFMRRGVRGASLPGVPMARYGRADQRIQRILDGTSLSRGVTRGSVVAILALGSPLAYVVAAAHPQDAPQLQTAAPPVPKTAAKPIVPDATPLNREPSTPPAIAQGETPSADVNFRMQQFMHIIQQMQSAMPRPAAVWLTGLGSVAPFSTVVVKPRVDGELLSVSFKEGELVQAGQVLANVDPRLFQLQLAQAEGQLARDEAPAIAHLEGAIQADRAAVDIAKLQLTYTTITAPITGVAGLRMVDAGNIVHASDALVVITQLQPIAVLFSVPEDNVFQVRALLTQGTNPVVEAWNRDNSVKLATGRLTAIDNQIDQTAGTAKLKAVFDNTDGALFPGQFVNVRLALNGQ